MNHLSIIEFSCTWCCYTAFCLLEDTLTSAIVYLLLYKAPICSFRILDIHCKLFIKYSSNSILTLIILLLIYIWSIPYFEIWWVRALLKNVYLDGFLTYYVSYNACILSVNCAYQQGKHSDLTQYTWNSLLHQRKGFLLQQPDNRNPFHLFTKRAFIESFIFSLLSI